MPREKQGAQTATIAETIAAALMDPTAVQIQPQRELRPKSQTIRSREEQLRIVATKVACCRQSGLRPDPEPASVCVPTDD